MKVTSDQPQRNMRKKHATITFIIKSEIIYENQTFQKTMTQVGAHCRKQFVRDIRLAGRMKLPRLRDGM